MAIEMHDLAGADAEVIARGMVYPTTPSRPTWLPQHSGIRRRLRYMWPKEV